MQWFEYPICVPFGNVNYDSGLGGSHDMDVQPPANTVVTALVAGTICDLSSPSWGKQVGVELDTPVNDVPYMAYLHLSAINPALSIGEHIVEGTIIGWTGGAYEAAMYNGTNNPTGENFLNDVSMSSQIQVGIALMRGPIYGSGAGWKVFPPIDESLNPGSLIDNAINALNPPQPPVQGPSAGMLQQMSDVWSHNPINMLETYLVAMGIPVPHGVGINDMTGIAGVWKRLYPKYNLGSPLGLEIATTDWNNNPIQLQEFAYGVVTWSLQTGSARVWNALGVELTKLLLEV